MHNFGRFFSRTSLASVALLTVIATGTAVLTPSDASAHGRRPRCSPDLRHRTPEEVIEEHVALIAAGNLNQAMCDYAPDATVILPGQVITGKDQIRQGLEAFAQLFGGAPPIVDTLTASGPVVLLTFHVNGSPFSVPNGSDTYVVKNGFIRYQTVHDELVPTP